MRAKKIAALLAATAILVALGVPTGARATKPKHYRFPPSTVVSILGRADKNFEFTFLGAGSYGSVLLLDSLGSNRLEGSVSYSVLPHHGRPAFEGDELDVRIGRLGRFRARFMRSSTETEGLQSGCTGKPSVTEKGYFVGSFSFHGERGYATIDSRREKGTVSRGGATSCKEPTGTGKRRHHHGHSAKAQREHEAGKFRLLAGDAKGHVSFQAYREESAEPEEGTPTTFQATVTERLGPLSVSRTASSLGFGPEAESGFLTPDSDHQLTEATVTPGGPFTGSATFLLESPKTASWTGDLAAEFLGLGTVHLTGNGIEAGACQGRSHCTETLPEPLQKELEFSRGDGSFYGAVTTTVGEPR